MEQADLDFEVTEEVIDPDKLLKVMQMIQRLPTPEFQDQARRALRRLLKKDDMSAADFEWKVEQAVQKVKKAAKAEGFDMLTEEERMAREAKRREKEKARLVAGRYIEAAAEDAGEITEGSEGTPEDEDEIEAEERRRRKARRSQGDAREDGRRDTTENKKAKKDKRDKSEKSKRKKEKHKKRDRSGDE